MSFLYPLYYRIYRIPLRTAFLLMALAVLLWTILTATFGRRHRKAWKAVNAALLAFLLLAIFCFTVLRRSQDPDRRVVLLPFASLQAARRQDEIYRELTMNILLFCPIGLFVSQLFSDRHSVLLRLLFTVLTAAAISLTVETLQYFFVCGDVETDDLLTNTAGAFIGALTVPCTALLKKIGTKQHKE